MANPHKGEVEVRLNKSVAKKLLKPHGAITIKFDYNAMADAELEFKGGATMVQVLNRMLVDPFGVSFHDTRILLEYGLKHQFPTLDRNLAGKILEVEDFNVITKAVGEALNLAFEGNIISAEDMKKYREDNEFTRSDEELNGAEEGAEEAKN